MHDSVLPMAFNSRPKVTFSEKGREDNGKDGEVQFTFGKEDEVTPEENSRPNSGKWSQMPEATTKAVEGM